MIQISVIIVLALFLLLLVRKGLIQVKLSMPWFMALVIFGLLSINRKFVIWFGDSLGIHYTPLAVVFVTIFILLGLITMLLIAVTRLRSRQAQFVRRLASLELERQEMRVADKREATGNRHG